MTSSASSSDLSPAPAGTIKTIAESRATPQSKASGKKRPSMAADENATPSKKRRADKSNGEQPGIYCHQCRRKFEADEVLRCTKMKQTTKSGAPRPCNLAFCESDLRRRFDIQIADCKKAGRKGADATHDKSSSYIFACPCCQGQCQTSTCRKKLGLDPLGIVTTPNKLDAAPPRAEGSSELSDVEPAVKKPKTPAKSPETATPATKTPSSAKVKAGKQGTAGKITDTKSPSKASTKKKAATALAPKKAGKAEPETKTKTKAKAKADKPKAKTEKPARPIPPPPVFKRMDTRLNHEDGEQRIMLREYLIRFSDVLSLNERALAVLDDFDRPLTESSVRNFASAMLGVLRADAMMGDDLDREYEEVKHYADLARFAKIYETLAAHFDLRMPLPPPAPTTDSTMKALLNLKDGQAPPQWATELAGTSRRVAASRIPQPAEIVRMLLALAKGTLSTPTMRAELDRHLADGNERRKAYLAGAAASKEWENKTKQMTAKAKQGKTGQEAFKRHQLKLAMIDVDLQASLSKRAARYEPIGEDVDGRLYYKLSHRVVNDTRFTTPWAGGLLVWGKGVQETATEGDPPHEVERWSHFNTSAGIAQLCEWLRWRNLPYLFSDRPDIEISNMAPRTDRVQVVLPKRPRANSDTSSLSELSVDRQEELLSHLHPQLPDSTLAGQSIELTSKLHGVARWLEVLEWQNIKGFGSD